MTCRDWRELFPEAYYGELAAGRHQEFDQHLAGCRECRAAYDAFRQTLAIMDKRSRPEPSAEFLSNFWERLEPRIVEEAAHETEPERERKKPRFRPAFLPAWAMGAAAVILLAVGIYLGRFFFVPGSQPTTAMANRTEVADTTARKVDDYLDRSRVLLLGFVNAPAGQTSSSVLPEQQQVARRLLQEGTVLKASLKNPDQAQLKRLIGDLEVVLVQLANYSIDNGVAVIELVRQGVDKKSILLKINLEELQRALSGAPHAAHDSVKSKT